MPARIVSIPFIIIALVMLYLAWDVDSGYAKYIVAPVISLAVIFTFSPQINWWWYRRNPPDIAAPLRILFEKSFPYYQHLTPAEQLRFRQRVALFTLTNDYMTQIIEDAPEDAKAISAACAVQLTFGLEAFLFPKFEHVVFYPKPFPSPQFPNKMHASEIFAEDGVLLFSLEQLARGFIQSQQFYNIGLHEYAKVFVASYPEHPWPEVGQESWTKLEQVSGFSRDFIHKWINLDHIEPLPVSICHFFVFPHRFKALLPELYDTYCTIFWQDPAGEKTVPANAPALRIP